MIDAEKERNEKAEKAVYDNSYNRGYRKGHSRGYKEGYNVALSEVSSKIKTMQGDIETLADVLKTIDTSYIVADITESEG